MAIGLDQIGHLIGSVEVSIGLLPLGLGVKIKLDRIAYAVIQWIKERIQMVTYLISNVSFGVALLEVRVVNPII